MKRRLKQNWQTCEHVFFIGFALVTLPLCGGPLAVPDAGCCWPGRRMREGPEGFGSLAEMMRVPDQICGYLWLVFHWSFVELSPKSLSELLGAEAMLSLRW